MPDGPGPLCPCCYEPVGHPANGCVLQAMFYCLQERRDLDEKEINDLWERVDIDFLWEDLGPVIDQLGRGEFQRFLDNKPEGQPSP
jgi:hypothetical protein